MGLSEALGGIIAGAGKEAGSGPFSRSAAYVGNRHCPNMVPGIPELLWAARTGWLGDDVVKWLLRAQGVSWARDPADTAGLQTDTEKYLTNVWAQIFASQQLLPAPGELLQLVNRDVLTQYLLGYHLSPADGEEGMKSAGYTDPKVRQLLLSLRHEIPGPSDLVRFALREAFNPQIVEKFGYNADFPDILTTWIGQQGYGYTVPGLRASPADPADKTWAHAYWWSHWDLPSPGQGYSMLQRLRPTGGPGGGPRDPSGQTFDAETLSLLLKAADYPSFWRDKLTAISYRVPGLRQISQLVDAGLVDRPELIEKWMDLGYNRDNATLLSDLTFRRANIRKHKAEIGGIKGKVLSAYDLGLYSKNAAGAALYVAGLEDPDLVKDFLSKPINEQGAIGLSEPGIRLQLEAADAARTTRLVKAAISATRKAYLNGRKSADEARAQLTRIGITDQAIEEYLNLWGLELDPERKSLTVAKVMHLFRLGLLPAISAKHRVERMGYTSDDAQLLLSEAEKDVESDRAKEAVRAARTLAQRQAALEKLVAAQRASHNRARSELARHGTPSQLQRWFVQGLILPNDAVVRLRAMDWPRDDIDRWLLESAEKRRIYLEKRAKANGQTVATGPSANGNGSPSGESGTAVP